LAIKKQVNQSSLDIITLLTKELSIIPSTSEVRRLLKQNAIKINDEIVSSIDFKCPEKEQFVLQVGKKITYKIVID